MIHLIVGNTGSGKTTYAGKLKKESGGIIFSIDQWNNTLFLPDKNPNDGLQWFLERIERVESMIIALILQLETEQTDAILDLGLSKFSHREKFRAFAREHDFDIKIHYIKVPSEIRWQRVMERNTARGDTFEFEVTRENFDFMESWFEEPTSTEMQGGIVIRNH